MEQLNGIVVEDEGRARREDELQVGAGGRACAGTGSLPSAPVQPSPLSEGEIQKGGVRGFRSQSDALGGVGVNHGENVSVSSASTCNAWKLPTSAKAGLSARLPF